MNLSIWLIPPLLAEWLQVENPRRRRGTRTAAVKGPTADLHDSPSRHTVTVCSIEKRHGPIWREGIQFTGQLQKR